MTSSASPTEPRYTIELTTSAARDVRKLPRPAQGRIRDELERLALDPRGQSVRRLTGVDAYRLRSGDYRIVFQIEDGERCVLVLLIAHRRSVYRRLARKGL